MWRCSQAVFSLWTGLLVPLLLVVGVGALVGGAGSVLTWTGSTGSAGRAGWAGWAEGGAGGVGPGEGSFLVSSVSGSR